MTELNLLHKKAFERGISNEQSALLSKLGYAADKVYREVWNDWGNTHIINRNVFCIDYVAKNLQKNLNMSKSTLLRACADLKNEGVLLTIPYHFVDKRYKGSAGTERKYLIPIDLDSYARTDLLLICKAKAKSSTKYLDKQKKVIAHIDELLPAGTVEPLSAKEQIEYMNTPEFGEPVVIGEAEKVANLFQIGKEWDNSHNRPDDMEIKFPQYVEPKFYYCVDERTPLPKVEGLEDVVQLAEKTFVESVAPTPTPVLTVVQPTERRSEPEVIKPNLIAIGLVRDFRKLNPKADFAFDDAVGSYVLSVDGQTQKLFKNTGEALRYLNKLRKDLRINKAVNSSLSGDVDNDW